MAELNNLHQRSSPSGSSFLCMPVREYMKYSRVAGRTEGRSSDQMTAASIRYIAERITIVNGVVGPEDLDELVRLCDDTNMKRVHQHRSPGAFSTSTLPSRCRSFVTIRFITIGSYRQRREAPRDSHEEEQVQAQVASQLAQNHQDCQDGSRNGFETFRAVTLLGQAMFAVEQQAVFFDYKPVDDTEDATVVATGNHDFGGVGNRLHPSSSSSINRQGGSRIGERHRLWSGVLLTDFGQPLGRPPWKTYIPDFKDGLFLSMDTSDMDLARFGSPRDCGLLARPNPFQARYDDSRHYVGDDDVNYDNYAKDYLEFVADLLETSALGWDQALNLVRSMLQDEGGVHLPGEAVYAEERMAVLERVKKLLGRGIRYFGETIRAIDGLQTDGLNGGRPSGHQLGSSNGRLATCRVDFVHLLDDAKDILRICQEATNTTMSNISVRASEETLHDGRRLAVITLLAFVFVPISFLSSVFGMNVAEMQKYPPIKVFVYFAVGTTVLSVTILFILLHWTHLKETDVGVRVRWAWREFLSIKSKVKDWLG